MKEKQPAVLRECGNFQELIREAREEERTITGYRFFRIIGDPQDVNTMPDFPPEFQNCVFENCRLSGYGFHGAYFADVLFRECDLSNADFSGSLFRRVRFESCKAVGADFTESVWEHTTVLDCSCGMANLAGAKLKHTTLEQSDFSGGGFQQCVFQSVSFHHCRLTRAELFQTPLKGINFTTCDIGGIVLSGEELRGAIVTPEQACDLSHFLGLIIR